MRGGEVVYSEWQELAEQTGWNKKVYGHFKSRVLLEGQKVFQEQTPLTYEITEIKKPRSRAVAGLRIKVTTQNPNKNRKVSLFPELSDDYGQAIKEIRYQLIAWLVSEVMIEKLLQNPFQFITDGNKRKEIQQKYPHKVDYLWEKMQYVAHAKNVKDEAKYLITAIKNNYVSKQQQKEKLSAERKAFREKQSTEIALLEQQVATVRNQATLLRIEIGGQILNHNTLLKDEVFAVAAQKHARSKGQEELNELFGNRNFFTYKVLELLKSKCPDKFRAIDSAEEAQLKTLKGKIQAVKNRRLPAP